MVGYLPSSPLTAVLLDFLCTPKIDLQNFNSSFSKQCLSNNSYLSHSILKTWSFVFIKGPQTSQAYVQIGLIRVSYRCRLSLGGRFNLFRDCLSLNIAFDAFLHRVSIAGLKLPLGTNSSPK